MKVFETITLETKDATGFLTITADHEILFTAVIHNAPYKTVFLSGEWSKDIHGYDLFTKPTTIYCFMEYLQEARKGREAFCDSETVAFRVVDEDEEFDGTFIIDRVQLFRALEKSLLLFTLGL